MELVSNMVLVSMRSFAFRKAKEEVEIENLRLRATKTVLVFEDGGVGESCRCLLACCEIEIQGKRERKERAAAANPASAEQPSDPGSTGPNWAAEKQHWVPLCPSASADVPKAMPRT